MKPYPLTHEGEGKFISRGQVMNFKSRDRNNIPDDFSFVKNLPPFQILTQEGKELKWRAACSDIIKLRTDGDDGDGNPTTTPEWGLTRADFYSRGNGRPEFKISLLYTIWNPTDIPAPELPIGSVSSGIPLDVYNPDDDSGDIVELIEDGRLNSGGQ